MPEFVAREPERARKKEALVADAIEAAMSRKAPPRTADPNYTFSAAGKL